MLATKAALASGGITHCCLRCGLRMFFLASARSCCRWRARQCAVRRPSPRAGAGSNGRNPPGPERGSARSILLLLRRAGLRQQLGGTLAFADQLVELGAFL